MKIALFSDTYLPDINGVVTSVNLLKEELERLGHEVYLFTNHKGSFKIIKEGNVIRLPGIEMKALYGYKATSPIQISFTKEFEDYHFDVIHRHTEFGVGILASNLAKKYHIPLIATYHTTYEDYTNYVNPLDFKTVEKGARKAVASLSKTICENCSAIIAPSVKTKTMLEGYGIKTPIEVIPTGINLDCFNITVDNDTKQRIRKECKCKDNDKLIIFVGRIAEEKSVDFIINGFKKVKEKGLNVKLGIVGDGPDLDKLKKLTDKLNLNDYIFFKGRIDHNDVPVYYGSSDAFISASTTETQGMTYIEALASSTPVLARYDDVLSNLIIDGKNGFFFNSEDEVYDVVSKIAHMSNEEINEMKKNAFNSSVQYDSKEFGKHVVRLYEQAIENYNSSFIITKAKLKEDYMVIHVESQTIDAEDKIYVSIDDYSEYGLRVGNIIDSKVYDLIKNKEDEVVAYQKVLKKVSNKEMTTKEVYDYLNNKFELDIKTINNIVEKLQSLKLINDEDYAKSKALSFKALFYSKRKVMNKLKDDGIPLDVIEKVVNESDINDEENIIHYANKYKDSVEGKSIAKKKETIISKLIAQGFKYEDSKKAVENLDFSEDYLEENDNLKKEFNKLYRKYKKKYEGTELRNKLYNSLIYKGYKSENIYAVLNEKEEEINE